MGHIIVVGANVKPQESCPICQCNHPSCRRIVVERPRMTQRPRPADEEARVLAWLNRVPQQASFCAEHFQRLGPVAIAYRADAHVREATNAKIWFAAFGHPSEARRPLVRVPLTPTIEDVLTEYYEREQTRVIANQPEVEGAGAGAGYAAAALVGQGGPTDGADRGRQEGGSGWLLRSVAAACGLFLRIAGR